MKPSLGHLQYSFVYICDFAIFYIIEWVAHPTLWLEAL